jgi:hypothetical protein
MASQRAKHRFRLLRARRESDHRLFGWTPQMNARNTIVYAGKNRLSGLIKRPTQRFSHRAGIYEFSDFFLLNKAVAIQWTPNSNLSYAEEYHIRLRG